MEVRTDESAPREITRVKDAVSDVATVKHAVLERYVLECDLVRVKAVEYLELECDSLVYNVFWDVVIGDDLPVAWRKMRRNRRQGIVCHFGLAIGVGSRRLTPILLASG